MNRSHLTSHSKGCGDHLQTSFTHGASRLRSKYDHGIIQRFRWPAQPPQPISLAAFQDAKVRARDLVCAQDPAVPGRGCGRRPVVPQRRCVALEQSRNACTARARDRAAVVSVGGAGRVWDAVCGRRGYSHACPGPGYGSWLPRLARRVIVEAPDVLSEELEQVLLLGRYLERFDWDWEVGSWKACWTD
ncbi:hypothetical protein BCR44DRAFT_1433430 [Catenaria anguillulae PL171]|uniref:Uncharacterized protein n=1 Tax=Catenaria anguillulae PL171 TaxID=765915 RepID=A0A1Y2HRF5_9FUNG|nr:hypothetical protein BCR44DRAFT_1433430 [Catenaria anguillulae PL171]